MTMNDERRKMGLAQTIEETDRIGRSIIDLSQDFRGMLPELSQSRFLTHQRQLLKSIVR